MYFLHFPNVQIVVVFVMPADILSHRPFDVSEMCKCEILNSVNSPRHQAFPESW